jgi:hypothetical protein
VRFELHDRITHPATLVLETMIERMETIVPFLANVESIARQERIELPHGRIQIVRRWQGAASAVPAPLSPFLSRDLFAWIDTAIWTPAQYKVNWTHTAAVPQVAKLYECIGENFFEPDPAAPDTATRVRLTGNLSIHADAIPGVPTFLGRRLAPQIERFIVGMIEPNLANLATGLQRYFDQAR